MNQRQNIHLDGDDFLRSAAVLVNKIEFQSASASAGDQEALGWDGAEQTFATVGAGTLLISGTLLGVNPETGSHYRHSADIEKQFQLNKLRLQRLFATGRSHRVRMNTQVGVIVAAGRVRDSWTLEQLVFGAAATWSVSLTVPRGFLRAEELSRTGRLHRGEHDLTAFKHMSAPLQDLTVRFFGPFNFIEVECEDYVLGLRQRVPAGRYVEYDTSLHVVNRVSGSYRKADQSRFYSYRRATNLGNQKFRLMPGANSSVQPHVIVRGSSTHGSVQLEGHRNFGGGIL